MNLVLCGMPGAGKTSAGKILAELSGRKFFDTDEAIAARFGEISQLFQEKGEGFFRAEEKNLCRRLSKEDGLVVATGGGTVLDEENAALLKANGMIIYLRARAQTLLSRLSGEDGRPLLKGDLEQRLLSLYGERAAIYEARADAAVDTDGLTAFETAKKILEVWA